MINTYWVAQFEDGFYYNEKLFRVANVVFASTCYGENSKEYAIEYFRQKNIGKYFEVVLIEKEL